MRVSRKSMLCLIIVFLLVVPSLVSANQAELEYLSKLKNSTTRMSRITGDFADDCSDVSYFIMSFSTFARRADSHASEVDSEYYYISNLNVPSTCQYINTHYLNALDYLSTGMSYAAEGARKLDPDIINLGTEYINKGTEEIELVNNALINFVYSTEDTEGDEQSEIKDYTSYIFCLILPIILLFIVATLWYNNKKKLEIAERERERFEEESQMEIEGEGFTEATLGEERPIIKEPQGTLDGKRFCAMCSKEIPIDANLCPYCGYDFR